MKASPAIPDPGVLRTFADTSFTPLRVYCQRIAPVFVPDLLMNEGSPITEGDCNELELQIVAVTTCQFAQAAGFHGDISFEECLCVAVALENDWTIITDDPVLEYTCHREAVHTDSTLGIVRTLIRSKLITRRVARRVARRVLRRHREPPDGFEHFIEELALVVPG